MRDRNESRARADLWIAWIRLVAVPFAVVEVGVVSNDYPEGYHGWAWIATGALGVGAIVLFVLTRAELEKRARALVGVAALVFDFAIVAAFVLIFTFEPGTPIRQLLFLPLVESALRFGLRGGLLFPVATVPVLVVTEWHRV